MTFGLHVAKKLDAGDWAFCVGLGSAPDYEQGLVVIFWRWHVLLGWVCPDWRK